MIDVSDPAGPVELGALDTPGSAWDVEVVGGLVYAADGLSGLQIIDFGPEYSWQISQDVSAAAGQVQLDFEIGSPDASTFATILILIYPQVLAIPLWAVPIPAIDPPVQFSVSFPLPVPAIAGFYSALITEQGVQAFDLDWIVLSQEAAGK